MYGLIRIADCYYIIPSFLVVPSDYVICTGTMEECEVNLAMLRAGYFN